MLGFFSFFTGNRSGIRKHTNGSFGVIDCGALRLFRALTLIQLEPRVMMRLDSFQTWLERRVHYCAHLIQQQLRTSHPRNIHFIDQVNTAAVAPSALP